MLVTAAAGGVGMATVDLAANVLNAKVKLPVTTLILNK